MSLLVLCPSRGRPEKVREAAESLYQTRTRNTTEFMAVVDADDPERPAYLDHAGWPVMVFPPSGRRGMADPVNRAIAVLWDDYDVIGFVGDDHRFRTLGWDAIFEDKLAAEPGMVYGHDLAWQQGEIPTQIFASSVVWKALGWLALPTAQHLYLDNAWRVIGEGVGRLFWYPDVVIEHVHPAFGKAEWDEGYRAVNSETMYDHDRNAFELWLTSGKAQEDVERVRQSLPR